MGNREGKKNEKATVVTKKKTFEGAKMRKAKMGQETERRVCAQAFVRNMFGAIQRQTFVSPGKAEMAGLQY